METIIDEQMEQDLKDCAIDLKPRKSGEDPTLAEEYAMTHVMEAGQYRVPVYIGMIKKLRKDIESGFVKGAYARLKELQDKERMLDEARNQIEQMRKAAHTLRIKLEDTRRDLQASKRAELTARAGIYRGMVQEMQAAGASGINLEKVEGWAHIAEKDAADAIKGITDPTIAQRANKIGDSLQTILDETKALGADPDPKALKFFETYRDLFYEYSKMKLEEKEPPLPPITKPGPDHEDWHRTP